MNLDLHYQALWTQSLKQFREGAFEYDPWIHSDQDSRYGLTLLARPTPSIRNRVSSLLYMMKETAPNQYFYPESDLHVTVLSIISCTADFSLDSINVNKYREMIATALQSFSPFYLTFRGISASPSCIMIQGFPEGNQLSDIRNCLRNSFKNSDLQHTIDKRYELETAHMSVIRFVKPIPKSDPFVKKLIENRDVYLGRCRIDKLELVGNNWYQQQQKIKRIETFSLKSIYG